MKKDFYSAMTLIEVMMSVAIFSLSIIGFTMLFSIAWKSNSFVFEEGQSVNMVSTAVNGVISDLRKTRQADDGEYPIKSADGNDLVVFIDIDGDGITEKVHYFYQNGQLKMGVSKPSGNPLSYPNTDTTVTIIANYIVNDANNPVFSYYNNNYPEDTTNNPLPTPVSNSNLENVRLIEIHLMININPSQAPNNINIESFAELRNLNDYNDD